MWSPPPEMGSVTPGTPYITTLRARIIQTMDYVLTCKDSEEAINAWEQLCCHGYALIKMGLALGDFDGLKNAEQLKESAQKLVDSWPPKSAEKTSITPCADGRYRAKYDSYVATVDREHIDQARQSLKEESQNVIRGRLMKFWGECYSYLLILNYLNLKDEIAVPVQMDDRYTKDKMRKGLGRWTPQDDGQRGDSKAPNVEGRATGHRTQ